MTYDEVLEDVTHGNGNGDDAAPTEPGSGETNDQSSNAAGSAVA